ncbi:MAG: hypothetical protein FWF12_04065 [Betaproteobacteria bacterium]|nr:hypothetical protein [Betaproteobacteria bacterium]
MAQFVYTGLQGHGKSFEVVRNVILPNFAKGRRIVTNITGLNVDLIANYCEEVLKASRSGFGEIISVDHSDLHKANFFPKEDSENPYAKALAACTDEAVRSELKKKIEAWRASFVVRGGDLIIIDECWRFYAQGEKLPPYHLAFFRMHRHFVHADSGQCCDIVLIVQDIGDLHRSVRATVEKSYLMRQHVDMGMRDRYVISIFAGRTQTGRSLIEGGINRKYDPAIFPLYKSHSQNQDGVTPKEERADKRGNIFSSKLFRLVIPLAILWLAVAAWWMWGFFHSEPKVKNSVITNDAKQMSPGVNPEKKRDDGVSDRWVLVGFFNYGGMRTYMLSDGSGKTRYLTDPPVVKMTPAEIELLLPDKSIVTRWSGPSMPDRRNFQGLKP